MKWTDIGDIAIALSDNYLDKDPAKVRFTDLMKMVLSLEGFNDSEAHCNEKILEAIQAAWIEESQ